MLCFGFEIIVSKLLGGEIFEAFVTLSATLLPFKSPVPFAVFHIDFDEKVLFTSVTNVLA